MKPVQKLLILALTVMFTAPASFASGHDLCEGKSPRHPDCSPVNRCTKGSDGVFRCTRR